MSNNTAIRKAFNDFLKVLKENSIVAPVKKISTEGSKKVKRKVTAKYDETQMTTPKTRSKTPSKRRTKTHSK